MKRQRKGRKRTHLGDCLCLGTIFFERYDTHCCCSSCDGASTSKSFAVNMSGVTKWEIKWTHHLKYLNLALRATKQDGLQNSILLQPPRSRDRSSGPENMRHLHPKCPVFCACEITCQPWHAVTQDSSRSTWSLWHLIWHPKWKLEIASSNN